MPYPVGNVSLCNWLHLRIWIYVKILSKAVYYHCYKLRVVGAGHRRRKHRGDERSLFTTIMHKTLMYVWLLYMVYLYHAYMLLMWMWRDVILNHLCHVRPMKRGGKFVAHKRPKGRVAVCRSDHIARPNACLQQVAPATVKIELIGVTVTCTFQLSSSMILWTEGADQLLKTFNASSRYTNPGNDN